MLEVDAHVYFSNVGIHFAQQESAEGALVQVQEHRIAADDGGREESGQAMQSGGHAQRELLARTGP